MPDGRGPCGTTTPGIRRVQEFGVSGRGRRRDVWTPAPQGGRAIFRDVSWRFRERSADTNLSYGARREAAPRGAASQAAAPGRTRRGPPRPRTERHCEPASPERGERRPKPPGRVNLVERSDRTVEGSRNPHPILGGRARRPCHGAERFRGRCTIGGGGPERPARIGRTRRRRARRRAARSVCGARRRVPGTLAERT